MSTSDEEWYQELKTQIEARWNYLYAERNGQVASKRNPYIRKTAFTIDDEREIYVGYETDYYLLTNSQRKIDKGMGIPEFTRGFAPTLPPKVVEWFQTLPYRHRPAVEDQQKMPQLFGKGLLLYGPPGTGKTVMAAEILRLLIGLHIRRTDPDLQNNWHGFSMGRFIDWQDASELFRLAAGGDEESAARAEEIRRAMRPAGPHLQQADFLVIDDISRERATQFNTTELQRILRHRFSSGWTTVVTTNTLPKDWEDLYGEVLANFLTRSFLQVDFSEVEQYAGQ